MKFGIGPLHVSTGLNATPPGSGMRLRCIQLCVASIVDTFGSAVQIAEMSALLHMVVSAMVTDRTAVKVTAVPGPARLTVFRVMVGRETRAK